MENGNKTAIIVGATGLVGSELLKYLLNSCTYEKVKVLTRRSISISHPKLEQIIVNFDKLPDYIDIFSTNDVYCCLGTTIKTAGSKEAFRKVDYQYALETATLAREKGAERFMIVTAMGADKHSTMFYNQVKGEVEEAVKALHYPSLHIFRPSLLLGARKEFRFGEKVAILLSPILSVIMIGKLKKYKPIQAKDVAHAMFKIGQQPKVGEYIYESDKIFSISKENN